MKSPPAGWPRMSASVHYDDANAAISWLCEAFAFTLRLKVEGEHGRVEHSELSYGEALVMVGQTGGTREPWQADQVSPQGVAGRRTQSLCLFVDDAEAHCERARAAGARIAREPRVDDYGAEHWADKSYGALDPEGHLWWFMERVRDQKIGAE